MPERTDYFCGLDLGQATDFTAWAVLERRQEEEAPQVYCPTPAEPSAPPKPTHTLRHLQRWPRQTSYTAIVAAVRALLERPSKSDPRRRPLSGCVLVVDGTGVGRGIVDMLREAKLPCRLRPVVIHGGRSVGEAPDGYLTVPKLDLAGCVQRLLGERRLKWDTALPGVDVLIRELTTFTTRITPKGNETAAADERSGEHDDMVLALALAAWLGETLQPCTPPIIVAQPARSQLDRLGGIGMSPMRDGDRNPYRQRR